MQVYQHRDVWKNIALVADYKTTGQLLLTCHKFKELIQMIYQAQQPRLVEFVKEVDLKLHQFKIFPEEEDEFILSDVVDAYKFKTVLQSKDLEKDFHILRQNTINALADINSETLEKVVKELDTGNLNLPALCQSIFKEILNLAKSNVNGPLEPSTMTGAWIGECNCPMRHRMRQALRKIQDLQPNPASPDSACNNCPTWKHGKKVRFTMHITSRKSSQSGFAVNLSIELLHRKKEGSLVNFSYEGKNFKVICKGDERKTFEELVIEIMQFSIESSKKFAEKALVAEVKEKHQSDLEQLIQAQQSYIASIQQ